MNHLAKLRKLESLCLELLDTIGYGQPGEASIPSVDGQETDLADRIHALVCDNGMPK